MATYEETLINEKTGESVTIRSNDPHTFRDRIRRKQDTWEKANARLVQQEERDEAIRKAERDTQEAQAELSSYRSILHSTLTVDDAVDWASLEDHAPFREYVPRQKPEWGSYSARIPSRSMLEFVPGIRQKRVNAEANAKEAFEKAMSDWKQEDDRSRKAHHAERTNHEKEREERHRQLRQARTAYEAGDREGVERYFELVLERSKYPESLSLRSRVQYEGTGKVLLVSMDLPPVAEMPRTKEHRYVVARKETVTIELGKKELEKFYDDVIYQIVLRTVHELFESDYEKHADMVVFNGWVDGTDARTGKDTLKCIVSLQVQRDQLRDIHLEKISPQECFRHLKGVTAGPLVNVAPVKPILTLKEDDDRIISADAVLPALEQSQNLAAMEWQQFEILVRDIISKEFAREGCKVEVTRASRDAGVDALAFDQDPIRGGKYVIQAKRYNNLVPVSAVRDLYGTVLNEGAVKGILITTSHYGPDALSFASNKPITLINGEELLYLFNKHGFDFQIQLTKKQRAASSVPY